MCTFGVLGRVRAPVAPVMVMVMFVFVFNTTTRQIKNSFWPKSVLAKVGLAKVNWPKSVLAKVGLSRFDQSQSVSTDAPIY